MLKQVVQRSFGCSIVRCAQGQAGRDFEQCHLLKLVPIAGMLEYLIFGLGRKNLFYGSMHFFFFLFA